MIEKMKRWIKNKAGVSPIIAIILMVAITVVLAATIYVWVSGFGGGGSKSISMSITQLNGADGNADVTFRVDSVSQGARWENIEYKTNASTSFQSITGSDEDGDGVIDAGETFDITGNEAYPGGTLTIRDKTSNSVILTKTFW
ncbi:MAG: archaellin/type IV pilin N-terminal domain-containing protein [Candidatus Thermoplasmatota archaeon]